MDTINQERTSLRVSLCAMFAKERLEVRFLFYFYFNMHLAGYHIRAKVMSSPTKLAEKLIALWQRYTNVV